MHSNSIFYFLMGLGIGAAAGVLCASKSGSETRDLLRNKSEEGARYAKQAASDAIDLAKEKADKLRQTASETIDSARQTVKGPLES